MKTFCLVQSHSYAPIYLSASELKDWMKSLRIKLEFFGTSSMRQWRVVRQSWIISEMIHD
ncbi:MAG: hypothetical protein NT121_20185 [Chloroflexi bacterium]|nr:hypothetical protein [Chloroflexota bacterium]